jgi:hypothetical protein
VEQQTRPREEPRSHVVGSRSPDSAAWDIVVVVIKTLRETVIRLGGGGGGGSEASPRQRLLDFWQNIRNNLGELGSLGIWLLFSVSAFLGLSIGPTFVSYLQSDSLALSASPTCGRWQSNGSTRDMIFAWNQAEEQAASYYRSCYEASPSIKECNLYADNGILSQKTDHDDCPFLGDVCLLGPKSAVTFDSGYLDARTLGVNTRRRLFYRRKNTCAPLVTDGYVDIQDNYMGFLIQAQFYYNSREQGPTNAQSRIFSLPGTSSPTYEVAIRASG